MGANFGVEWSDSNPSGRELPFASGCTKEEGFTVIDRSESHHLVEADAGVTFEYEEIQQRWCDPLIEMALEPDRTRQEASIADEKHSGGKNCLARSITSVSAPEQRTGPGTCGLRSHQQQYAGCGEYHRHPVTFLRSTASPIDGDDFGRSGRAMTSVLCTGGSKRYRICSVTSTFFRVYRY
ncbi:hypothetical protein [Enterobacter hormaechei]|uniref:hypothetical protein n=1 Tax=Enterobacter hormaechei TaxID=158836 RepID=UPI0039AECCB0